MSESNLTVVHLEVPDGYRACGRLDVYISEALPNLSRSKAQRLIKDGHVSVDGKAEQKVSTPVQAGRSIEVRLQRPPPVEAMPEDIPLSIVYEDEWLIVVDKPAGMVVHPAYGHRGGTLVNALLFHVGGAPVTIDEAGEIDDDDEDVGLSTATAAPRFEGDVTVRPGIVHRLDKDTSGLLVVAKNDMVHAQLAAQFMDRSIRRSYLAILWGVPDPPEGTVESFLGRDHRDRKRIAVVPEQKGKHAVTHYEVVEGFQHLSVVRFRLETGRTHQIRVHAKHIGRPVLGDRTYGGDSLRFGPDTAKRRQFFQNLFSQLPRQALHAQLLGFVHPVTKDELDFEAPIPEDMAAVISRLISVEG